MLALTDILAQRRIEDPDGVTVAECVDAVLRLKDAVEWSAEDERHSVQEHQECYRNQHSGDTPGEAEEIKERELCGCPDLRWNDSKLRHFMMSDVSIVLGDK